jgi:transcriptional regulator with XRE-family HTH domain
MKPDRTPIAPWTYLRNLRLDKGKTIAQAAAEIGISRQHLNQMELGYVGPSDLALFALANYYDQTPSALNATRPPLRSRVGEFAAWQERAAAKAAEKTAA